MINPAVNIKNEIGRLRTLVLGIPDDFGGTPTLEEVYDPNSREHVLNGTFPIQEDVTEQMQQLEDVLLKYDVQILRPENIPGVNQIFVRDIAFVIDDKFIIPNIIKNRHRESEGIEKILDMINPDRIIQVDHGIRMEGGDIMPWNDEIFVGYSEPEDFNKYKVSRTNKEGVEFLIETFPHRNVHAFELNKSDVDPLNNALHLDCCFQPIGRDQAIIYRGGFKNEKDVDFLLDYFGKENLIEITQQEMHDMNSNIFSISPEVIISCHTFTRLNRELEKRGFTVEKISYEEIAKMEGLLRCSTMPLVRD